MGSRTKSAAKNTIFSIQYQLMNILLKFVMRSVFIHCLGKEYLGVSGVFSNILTILALSELGIGTAIIYDLYDPIAKEDKNKITQLIKFYRNVYGAIGIFIVTCGICLIPFLDKIIKDVPSVNNIIVIYILLLINTAGTYFFAHYISLFDAYQKNYINTSYNMIFAILKVVLECVFLWLFHSYIVYLIIELLVSFTCNFFIYKNAIKYFSFIQKKVEPLNLSERKHIFVNAVYNFSRKFSGTVVCATDNILMSILVSTIAVGVYSNYALIMQIISSSTVLLVNALTAGVGNFCVSESKDSKYKLFRKINFIYFSLYMLISVGFLSIIQPFIRIWIGDDYLLSYSIVIIVMLNFFISGMKQPLEIYISADGLFRKLSVEPWITAVFNVLFSIMMGKRYGVLGIVLGTTISQLLTDVWFYGYIVFKFSFEQNVIHYVKNYIKNIAAVTVACILAICGHNYLFASLNLIGQLFANGIFALVIFGVIWILVFHRTEEYAYFQKMILKIISKSKCNIL